MKLRVAFLAAVTAVLVVRAAWAEPLPTAKPEQVGLSSSRLERVGQSFEAQIGRARFPGAAVIIMRKGKIAYFETFGQRDPATRRADDQGRHLPPLLDDEAVRVGGRDDAGRGRQAHARRSRLEVLPAAGESPGRRRRRRMQMARPPTSWCRPSGQMTVQDLLRHTSGIVYSNNTPNQHVKEAYLEAGVDWRDVTPAEQIERLAKVPLAHQPGHGVGVQPVHRHPRPRGGGGVGHDAERVPREAPVRPAEDDGHRASSSRKPKVARLAQPFATDKETGKPIELLDVTVAQKNDAGGAGSAATDARLRALPADAAQRRPARRRPSAESRHRRLHDR